MLHLTREVRRHNVGNQKRRRMPRAPQGMTKQDLSESDICDKFIRPAMVAAGWNTLDQIYREYPLRARRVVVRGKHL